jgi:hypothetical protein
VRFEVPLYTVAEAARVLAVPLSTFPPLGARLRTPASRRASAWLRANGLVDEHTNSGLTIPFVGLAEDMVLPQGVAKQRHLPPSLRCVRHRRLTSGSNSPSVRTIPGPTTDTLDLDGIVTGRAEVGIRNALDARRHWGRLLLTRY